MPTSTKLRPTFQGFKGWLQSTFKNWRPQHALLLILLVGLIQGIIYAAIIPPWWHNDEPGHFEYAWLAANLPAWPKPGQYDQAMRKQMAVSLIKYNWYGRGMQPDLSGSGAISIGVPQTGDPPGYYFLASLPLRLMHNADITVQYYAARSMSFLLYLLIIVVIWYALGEILREDHPLRWMVPAFLALLPGFIDAMTAINNDVAATLAASLFLWASLRLIKRGYSIGRLVFIGLTLAFCYLSKNTAWFTFLLTPLVLILGLLRGRFTWPAIGISLAGALIAALAMLGWGAPLGWYQTPAQGSPLRSASTSAPLGNYIFQIDSSNTNLTSQISQFLTPATVKSLRGQTVTLGGWLWANPPTQIMSPYITTFSLRDFSTGNGGFNANLASSPQTSLELTTHPTFYRFVIHIPTGALNASIYISYSLPPASKIFADGLVLAMGEHSDTPPHFTNPNGTQGGWDGHKFQNLIRNGSAEQNNIRLQPVVGNRMSNLSNSLFDPSFIVSTILDREGMGWYYSDTFASLFRTFWASLAADRVKIPAFSNYFLMLLTALGVAGSLRLLWVKRNDYCWDVLFFLGLSLLFPWALAVLRGASGLEVESPIISWARYAYPAILPTALLLCGGWLEWFNLAQPIFKFENRTLNAIFVGGMVGISTLGITDAIQNFYPSWWHNWEPLIFLLIFQIISIQAIIIYGRTQLNS